MTANCPDWVATLCQCHLQYPVLLLVTLSILYSFKTKDFTTQTPSLLGQWLNFEAEIFHPPIFYNATSS